MSVAVLCARKDSVYKQFSVCDVWDQERNAWNYRGPLRAICHPPCGPWGKFSQFVKAGDAAFCEMLCLGLFCARVVQEFGGVLEHPAGSLLFRAAGLPRPGERGRGFTIQVPQYWFGHLARKDTWLYFCGVERVRLPRMPFRLDEPRRVAPCGVRHGTVEWLSQREREATPPALARWLVEAVS